MNCQQAKDIPITSYLASKGIKADRGMITSPLRDESTASFKITNDRIWFDFGIGKGGNIIDLVMQVDKVDLSGALNILSKLSTVPQPAPVKQLTKDSEIIISKIELLSNKALLDYLQSRKIPVDLARQYVSEVYYKVNGKNYFSIAFRNDSGGYELRNKYFKNCTSPKDLTTIDRGFNRIAVFEGFFDFLSYLTFFNCVTAYNYVILNSLSFLDKFIDRYRLRRIELYLDNDQAGIEATNKCIEQIKDASNMAPIIYRNYKDFNEFLINYK